MSRAVGQKSLLKQRRRRRRRRRQVKNDFLFYKRISQMFRSAWYANGSKNLLRLNMQPQCTVPCGNAKDQPSSSTFRGRHRTWSFYVLVLQRTAKKCSKSYNARALLLFCLLNLLFNDVLVAVVVVVCLSSLLKQRKPNNY